MFFATEALFILQWSLLSDRVGRKPILLTGSAGLCLSMICFGLSKTFWGLVIRFVDSTASHEVLVTNPSAVGVWLDS